ncbi:MAG: 3-hydroxyacyl-CoA dehydrogenase NAD-binding domain-containing protein, partial [Polyangiaceae bacterium]|nr:3-hydroxyacyl-CoA dehydrogenase NAD-binding domain-containing protein [Polyangiaceae bacterium]
MSDATKMLSWTVIDGVARVVIDSPGETVNTLHSSFAIEFEEMLDAFEADESVASIVLSSGKEASFVAGADIKMLAQVGSKFDGIALSQQGQKVADRMANFPVPIVAAIHGSCLGGGLELVLACQARIASNAPATKLGLPEVQLGILPGMGGTQRLPRLIGLTDALDLLLTGRQLDARRALKLGLIDRVVPPESLLVGAVAEAKALSHRSRGSTRWARLKEAARSTDLKELALADNPLGRKLVFDQAQKNLRAKTHGNYPAPEMILEVVRHGLERGLDVGLQRESEAFGDLVVTKEARALRHIFLSQTALKKEKGAADGPIRQLQEVMVLGAGLMGAGIAYTSAVKAGAHLRLKDIQPEAISRGLRQIDRLLQRDVQRKKMRGYDRRRYLNSLSKTTDFVGVKRSDLVIEAVLEDLELKRRVLREVEESEGEATIFASNTSSLPIGAIAENSRHPERVIGMHYFSPVEKMPLLEVIVTEKTADWVVRAVVAYGKRQGKTVIVVGDGPGFYTTRILTPYLNEAAFAVLEGAKVEDVDAQLLQAGFPIGPLALLDEVGIDVGAKVARTMFTAMGERMAPPSQLTKLLELGRQGKKNQSGFYL